jgi:hypothetical protein
MQDVQRKGGRGWAKAEQSGLHLRQWGGEEAAAGKMDFHVRAQGPKQHCLGEDG